MLPHAAEGMSYTKAAHILYEQSEAILLGVVSWEGGIILNPGASYVLSNAELAFIIARSAEHAREAMTFFRQAAAFHRAKEKSRSKRGRGGGGEESSSLSIGSNASLSIDGSSLNSNSVEQRTLVAMSGKNFVNLANKKFNHLRHKSTF